MKGPFSINMPASATRLTFSNLPTSAQTILSQRAAVDLSMHDLYEVVVVPQIKILDCDKIPRSMKRKSYHKVDRVLIHADISHSEDLVLVGILPTTETATGQLKLQVDEIEGKAFDVSFKLKGVFKNFVRRSTHNIFAQRNKSFAQWVFMRNYVQGVADYTLRLVFTAPKALLASERYAAFSVDFQDGGRSINRIRRKIVNLPI